MSMKNYSDANGNRTRDLPACSASTQFICIIQSTQLVSFTKWNNNGSFSDISDGPCVQPKIDASVLESISYCALGIHT